MADVGAAVLAGCDKSLPGMMMAMLRLNVPSIFVYGGSILPGSHDGKDVTVKDVFEAVGQYAAGNCPLKDLVALADAVREGRDVAAPMNGVAAGFSDPVTGVHGGALMAPPAPRSESNGRRRGHLRVLPDPPE